MIQGITAQYLVHSAYRVGPGTTVLVHAAAGGTGSLICQVAKNAGNRIECKTSSVPLFWIRTGIDRTGHVFTFRTPDLDSRFGLQNS